MTNIPFNIRRFRTHPLSQTGAALATALIMLLVLTVVGVSALNTITVEETMAGNMRDQIIAFQASETGMRDSEMLLEYDSGGGIPWFYRTKVNANCVDGGSPAICDSSEGSVFYNGTKDAFEEKTHDDAFWGAGNGAIQYGSNLVNGNVLSYVSTPPSYFIEKLGPAESDSWTPNSDSLSGGDGKKLYYRATSRGKGGNPNTVSIVQSTTAVRGIR